MVEAGRADGQRQVGDAVTHEVHGTLMQDIEHADLDAGELVRERPHCTG
jgi:hypothetical protein